MMSLHEQNGVVFIKNEPNAEIITDPATETATAVKAGGRDLIADVVLLAVGSTLQPHKGSSPASPASPAASPHFAPSVSSLSFHPPLGGGTVALSPSLHPEKEKSGGFVVDEMMRTTVRGLYAVGDLAFSPFMFLGGAKKGRIEHYGSAVTKGRIAAAEICERVDGIVRIKTMFKQA